MHVLTPDAPPMYRHTTLKIVMSTGPNYVEMVMYAETDPAQYCRLDKTDPCLFTSLSRDDTPERKAMKEPVKEKNGETCVCDGCYTVHHHGSRWHSQDDNGVKALSPPKPLLPSQSPPPYKSIH